MSVHFRWGTHQFHRLLASGSRDEVAPYILRFLDRQGPILEAGCGLGRFVSFMEKQGYRNVHGIDISPDAVAIVNRLAPHLSVTCGDVSDLPFEDSSIGGIVSLGVVEHFQQGPQPALQEFHRVMRPGARAIITVPYLNLVRSLKHAARIYQVGERMRARRSSVSAKGSRDDVVGRSIAHLDRDGQRIHPDTPSRFMRWPTTGPFFEFRFRIKQFEAELWSAGLSILGVIPIDTISGMFYEFGAPLVTTSPDGDRVTTRLGSIIDRVLARAPWIHAHMLLFVVQKDEVE